MPKLALTNLLLDMTNPRFDTEQENQRDAIHKMAVEQDEKLLNLAEDIVQFSLDPSSLSIVIPAAEKGRHIVVEGNRRILALKLLHNPQLVQGIWKTQQERRLKGLSQEFKKNPIKKVECIALPDRDAADHWIQLRHRGEQNGRGIVPWDGLAAARYEQRRGGGRSHAALQAIDLVRQKAGLDQATVDRLNNVPVTTVQRLLNDPEVRKTLGVDLNKGELTTNLPEQEALKGLTRIIKDAAHGRLPVSFVETKEHRARYVSSFTKNELPAPSAQRGESRAIAASVVPTTAPRPPKPIATSQKRNTLIPRSCVLIIRETKSNDIYHELRRMRLDDFPIAVSVLFRVFLELSVDHYITSKKLLTKLELDQASMRHKLDAVASALEQSKAMTKGEATLLRHIGNPQHFLAGSIDSFHAYVHDQNFTAGPGDLIAAWTTLEPFFKQFWE